MNTAREAGIDWTDEEVDVVVADYFDMLGHELAGHPYVKADRNRALQKITGRSKGSIEFKHQNITAVLIRLGLPWIRGYKPMANFQRALLDGVERYLDARPEWLSPAPKLIEPGLAESPALYFEPPPILEMEDGSVRTAVLARLVRKFDPAERDARNRKLGRSVEERLYFAERNRLASVGRADLAARVSWVSEEEGDGAGYDIRSFDEHGAERLLEVKTTIGHSTTPFYLSENERLVSEERPDAFRLIRLYDFARSPKAFKLVPPLHRFVRLEPMSYRASFRRRAVD